MIPEDKTYMQYLKGLADGRSDRRPHAQELLTVIGRGDGHWAEAWKAINSGSEKNLFCPICCKCIQRVMPDRHPNCWCQTDICLFYRTPKRGDSKRNQSLCPICVSGQPFGSSELCLQHIAGTHS